MNKLLIDTNIFIYGIDEDSQFYEKARRILDSHDKDLFTTSKNLSEFLAVVTKTTGYNLKTKEALEIIEEILQNVQIIYPSFDSYAIFLDLLHRYQPKGLKIHDFEIASIGLAHGIKKVATININDFKSIKEILVVDL